MILFHRARTRFLLALSLAACAHSVAPSGPLAPEALQSAGTTEAPASPSTAPRARVKTPPSELFDVTKVVDGDTIWVQRNGKVEKLRLLSVDTEEQLSTASSNLSSTKPPTVFGEECALWARSFFAGLAHDGALPRVGLHFPGNVEKRDFYGRLLCDVILPDGTNYNLMLVELGKSPYFTKYGWSETDHEAYVAAQKLAQSQKLGIWNPETNKPKTPGVPAARRPYDKLVPWWDARGLAVQEFRRAQARQDATVLDTEDEPAMTAAARANQERDCFGEVGKIEEQPDGSLLVHLRASSQKQELVIRIPKEALAQPWSFDLRKTPEEFHQNYVWIHTRIEAAPKGFIATTTDAKSWKLAGPEPR
jgi:endonuclease YncB( thermonuclease family)